MAQSLSAIHDKVSNLKDIATLPPVFTRIMAVVQDPNSTALDLAAEISLDPALAAKLLRIVNSSYYGMSREILTISDAVIILGFDEVERMALAMSIIESFGRGRETQRAYRLLWRHSIACSLAGQVIESDRTQSGLRGLHVAALLHDIGKAIIYQHFPELVSPMFKMIEVDNVPPLEAERRLLDGATHCDLGAWLGESWNLPPAIVAGIQFHHAPELATEHREMALATSISNWICKSLGLAALQRRNLDEILPDDEKYGSYAQYQTKIKFQLEMNHDRIGAFCCSASAA